MARYDLVQNDLTEPIGMILGDGGACNGSGALPAGTTVTFTMSQADGTKRVSGPGVIDDYDAWAVHYQWQPGDTNTPGVYWAQWTLSFGGLPESFPSDEPLYIIIRPSL